MKGQKSAKDIVCCSLIVELCDIIAVPSSKEAKASQDQVASKQITGVVIV